MTTASGPTHQRKSHPKVAFSYQLNPVIWKRQQLEKQRQQVRQLLKQQVQVQK
jgi:hypothetical protein